MATTRRSKGDLYRPLSDVANLQAERPRAADMISVGEAAAELNLDPQDISRGIAEGRGIGIVGTAGDLRLPRWRFEPSIWPEIEAISERLGTVDGWTLLGLLEARAKALEDMSPRTALERGVSHEVSWRRRPPMRIDQP